MTPTTDDAPSEPFNESIDVMNDPAFQVNDQGQDASTPDTCRICRGESQDDEPLFHPCKCSGSIKFVHQDCLMAWLSHSNKKYCELCKASFRFTRLYKDDMPKTLPWRIFFPRVILHVFSYILFILRSCLALSVWLVMLPMIIRYAWRGLFYIVDVEWARHPTAVQIQQQDQAIFNLIGNSTISPFFDSGILGPVSFRITRHALKTFITFVNRFGGDDILISHLKSHLNGTDVVPRHSLLSSLEKSPLLTTSLPINRMILDILEGQLILVLVIVSWLVITLIRESIVQQQTAIAAAADMHETETDAARNMAADTTDVVPVDVIAPAASSNGADDSDREHPLDLTALREDFASIGFDAEGDHTSDSYPATSGSEVSTTEDGAARASASSGSDAQGAVSSQHDTIEGSEARSVRPPMPSRQSCYSAHEVQRGLEERQRNTTALEEGESRIPTEHSNNVPGRSQGPPEPWPPSEETVQGPDSQNDTSHQHEDTACNRQDMVVATHSLIVGASENVAAGSDTAVDSTGPGHFQDLPANQVPHWPFYNDEVEWREQHTLPNSPLFDDGQTQLPADAAPRPTMPATVEEGHAQDDLGVQTHAAMGPAQLGEPVPAPVPGPLMYLYDYFWGDIALPTAATNDNEQQARPHPHAHNHGELEDVVADADHIVFAHDDPPVLDGELNAEQIDEAEDAEDLQGAIQGILELLGIHGPLVLLAQATAFSGAFVTVTLWGAIGAPYMFGKLALLYLAHPLFFGILLPLHMIKTVINVVSDVIVCTYDSLLLIAAHASKLLPKSIHTVSLESFRANAILYGQWARTDLIAAFERLSSTIAMRGAATRFSDSSFLMLSMTARHSLQVLQDEITIIYRIPFILSQKYLSFDRAMTWTLPPLQPLVLSSWHAMQARLPSYLKELQTRSLTGLQIALSMNHNDAPTLKLNDDQSLTQWSSADRLLTIILGYAFLAMLGAFYIAAKPPLYSSKVVRVIESTMAAVIVQTGQVIKVILIIGTELVTFPVFRGVLINIATLPLFEDATMATRIAYAQRSPYMATLFHWFLGMACTLNFGSFISMLRKKLRRGVLDFVKGPDDPDFHPVRVVLELTVPSQITSLLSAALFYGVLILVGLGAPVWTIHWVKDGTFPVRWTKPEPLLEFPIGFLLYFGAIPLMLRYLNPIAAMPRIFDWWLRRAARRARLSHFLFGDRQKDEEYSRVGSSDDQKFAGRYVRVPASDKARAPGEKRVFTEVSEKDVEESELRFSSHSTKKPLWRNVYVPPAFKLRLIVFVVALWSLCFLIGSSFTLVPLLVGRAVCYVLATPGAAFGDTWAFTLGLNIVLQFACIAKFGASLYQSKQHNSRSGASLREAFKALQGWSLQALQNIYVYGGITVLAPVLCIGALLLYAIIPWRTYLFHGVQPQLSSNPQLPSHIFANKMSLCSYRPVQTLRLEFWSDWSIGYFISSTISKLLYRHNHRLLEAVVGQVVRNGYFRPDHRLATRAIHLPLLLCILVMFGGPLLGARIVEAVMPAHVSILGIARPRSVLLYRYSYPFCAAVGCACWLATRALRATLRWRNEIRDEVYLLGSKLHNWGELKPAEGSRALLMTAPNDNAVVV